VAKGKRHPLISGARVTSLGTLSSRLLGMVRDIATAALLGLSSGGVMDAFVIAYRIPNLLRRLFGEGALTASYLPVLSAELEKDRAAGWRLASVVMTWLSIFLAVLVLLGEVLFALAWLAWGGTAETDLLLGLAAVMMPYLLLICLAAQLTATLHALSHFSVPAFTPVVLNVCWLAGVWLLAPMFAPDKHAQAYVIAVAVVIAGFLQVGVQLPVLFKAGFRYDYDWRGARGSLVKIGTAMAPMLVGLAVTQVNTFLDSLIAWGLAADSTGSSTIAWLGHAVEYPMQRGAAAALYYGERMYYFPLGVLGLAVAAAIFPLLSRHVARGDRDKVGVDLTLGLRLVVCLGVPAGVGLIMLAAPLTRLLFEHGQFTAEDTARTARVITCYSIGVWAFCALPVMIRGFYALGDYRTPAKVACWIVGFNLSLNLILIWTPLAEAGLATATSIAATVQLAVLTAIFSRRKSRLDWPALSAAALRTVLCTALMAVVGLAVLWQLPSGESIGRQIVHVSFPIAASVAVYCGAYWLSGGRELAILLTGRVDDD